MIIPILQGIHCPDIEDLKTYRPDNPGNFVIHLQIFVGLEGSESSESFNFTICTPTWIKENTNNNEYTPPKYHLVVHEYNYEKLVRGFERLIKSIAGQDWNEYAQKLAQFGHWEFEDYKEYKKEWKS